MRTERNATGKMPDRIDEETVAALIDGKLSGRERNAVLARLAASDEDHDAFTDAAVIVREIEDAERAATRFSGGAITRAGLLGRLLRRLSAAIRFHTLSQGS